MKNHSFASRLLRLWLTRHALNINVNYAKKTIHEGVSTFVGSLNKGTGVFYHFSEENKQNINISGQKGHLFGKPKAEANNRSARQ